MVARQNPKIRRLHLQHHRVTSQPGFAQTGGNFFRQGQQGRQQIGRPVHIVPEGGFIGYAFGRSIGDDGSIVLASGHEKKVTPELAEASDQIGLGHFFAIG